MISPSPLILSHFSPPPPSYLCVPVSLSLSLCRYHIPYAELSALTADNVEGALLELVRSIIQGDDTVSTLRKSVDSAMKRGESKSGTSPPGSGERSKDKEKCVVC
jgi:hypothetical protein